MAKGKGKSKRRQKDWHQHYREQGDSDQAAARQSLRQREVKIPAYRLEAQEENLDALDRIEGCVVGMYRGGAFVRPWPDGRMPTAANAPNPDDDLMCGIAKAFRAPDENSSAIAPGDVVTVALSRSEHTDGREDLDKDRVDGLIVSRRDRETVLCRPQPRSAKRRDEYDDEFVKVIAANMDNLLIVAAVKQPRLRRFLVDRFLIVAERGGLTPVVLFNKIDLGEPPEDLVAELADLDVPTYRVSAATGEGVEEVRAAIAGARNILAGASGVGKTTFINALLPGVDAVTRSVRAKDERGRHTTTSTIVYQLPAGGLILDTPGIRELGVQMNVDELPWYFPEFEPYVTQCRFNDCTHTHEPDCAVLDAVEAEEISPRRYESYLRILETL